MGTDLWTIGNHKIKFKNKQFGELTKEIKIILDKAQFSNADFLRLAALSWANSEPKNVRQIREIKTKQEWTFEEESDYFNFQERKCIQFLGPFNLWLTFEEHRIIIWNPPYRYRHWFKMEDDIHRDEWRKYMFQIVTLFGGDRVIYLADNAHPLEGFFNDEVTFKKTEKALLKRFGNPKQTFKEVAADFENSYFIDYFKTINWETSESLDEYLPEPDDTSSTAYDLEKYSSKQNLKELRFNDEDLLHKLIDDKIHFYHIAVLEGLLCLHTGIVGESEKLEVVLDKYAPFTYDKLKTEIEQQGFGNQCLKSYTIKLIGEANSNSWRNALKNFETDILWNGLGRIGGGYWDAKGKVEKRFSAVNETLALKLLLDLGEKYKSKGEIKVVRNEGDKEIVIYKH